MPTTKKIENIVEVHDCKVGNPSHRHGQLEVLPWISAVFTKSADKLAKEMTHDLGVNFIDIITRLGTEDTAKELRFHAAETQDTWVDAAENTEVTEIEHAACRALNELRAATTKGFDIKETIRLERIDHEQVVEKRQTASRAKKQQKGSTH